MIPKTGNHPSEQLPSKVRMADTPRPVQRTKRLEEEWKKVPKAIRLALFLYIVWDPERNLNEYQLSWIAHFSGKLDENQLFRAFEFYQKLASSDELLRRTYPMIVEAHRRLPLDGPPLPDRRRIGIGYRDKGALRPLHQKREFGEESFWSEDIKVFLPYQEDEVGRWITATEVKSLIGENLFELLLKQLGIVENPLSSIPKK